MLGGKPVFRGTRLPVSTLFEYLADGLPLDYFLESFPSVTRNRLLAFFIMASAVSRKNLPHENVADECVPVQVRNALPGGARFPDAGTCKMRLKIDQNRIRNRLLGIEQQSSHFDCYSEAAPCQHHRDNFQKYVFQRPTVWRSPCVAFVGETDEESRIEYDHRRRP